MQDLSVLAIECALETMNSHGSFAELPKLESHVVNSPYSLTIALHLRHGGL